MVEIISSVDTRPDWAAYTSRWSSLEVARALRGDGKPKALIELDLKELRSHKIRLIDLSRRILSAAETFITSYLAV